MKILCVSDVIEPKLNTGPIPAKLTHVDLILSCGDLPPEYLSALVNRFEVPLYYVKGNHDIRYEDLPMGGCINLHTRLVTYGGIRILGLAGSRWYNGGPNQFHDSQMKRIIAKMRLALWRRQGVDIVITHAPPRLVHDAEDRCHRGFSAFHRLIENHGPRYLLHGHIHRYFAHPLERMTLLSRTTVINCYGHYVLNYGNDESI